MNFLKHATAQPFIAATGLAALVHSAWALGVLFAGEPPVWEPTSIASWARWTYWLVPALLIAFALDVGQIATSAEIRSGQRTVTKYITFVVFALATYYLQWIYIVHHMPDLDLGPGVYSSGLAGRVVLLTRNAAIWVIPALLPLSTTMYTLSGDDVTEVEGSTASSVQVDRDALPESTESVTDDVTEQEAAKDHHAECPSCGWTGTYTNPDSARRGLAAHRQHCTALHPEKMPGYSNGAKEHIYE